jgi:hypothetical protein
MIVLSPVVLFSDNFAYTFFGLIVLAGFHVHYNHRMRANASQTGHEIKALIQKRHEQLREEIFQLIFHAMSFLLIAIHIPGINVWVEEMHIIEPKTAVDDLPRQKLAYFANYFHFYFYLMLLALFDPKIEKRNEMLTHHCATVFLMYTAGSFGYLDVSTYVLFINNITDLMLGPSKIFNAYKNVLRIPFFVAFTLCHIVLRCLCFPYSVYKMSQNDKIGGFSLLVYLLCVPLVCLNYFWIYPILKTCVTFFKAPKKRVAIE